VTSLTGGYAGYRLGFRVTTVVWGVAFLAAAAAQAVIIQTAPTGTAKTTSHALPLVVVGVVVVWNISYAKRGRRQGELAAQAARARGETPSAMPTE
jgi:hypothetical protein